MELQAADRLVQEFIARHHLLPEDWLQEVQVGEVRLLQSMGVSSDEPRRASVINLLLSYRRMTDKIGWIGPGSEIQATIESGEVVAIDRPWREVTEVATRVAIREPGDILQHLFDKLAELHGKPIPRGMFRLDRIEFGYYAMGKHAQQRFLQPAYQVFYRTTKEVFAAIAELIPAHDAQVGPLGPPAEPARPPLKHRPAPPPLKSHPCC
jgi:hypothetical protein